MALLALVIVGCIIVTCFIAWDYLTPSVDLLEPPVVWPKIPILGHAIGLARQSFGYYLVLR